MKKLYFLITLAILVISCEKEEINTKFLNEVATHPVELLKYTQLPPEIHEHLDIINNAASQKGEQIFGNIDKRIVIKRIKSGKDFSYTFSLLKIELAKNQLNNYYFDNLVFKDNKNSNPIVIRYIPTIEWQEGERDIRKFSGQIVFYTLEGKKINQIEVENGMQVASDEKQVCHYTLESVVLQCYGGEGSMLDQPYKCYKIYTYKESCTSGGSPGDGGGGTGTGPGDPPSIPSEPTEGWEPGGSNGGGITDPTIQDPKCQTTLEDVKKVFPNTNENILRTITALINIYGKDFGIDTEEKMQHFLAQAGHESTNYAGTEFSAFEENLNYRIANLGIKDFGLYFNPVTNPTENPAKANPNDYIRSSNPIYVDPVTFANYVYADINRGFRSKLGNISAGDGYKYRGRGIFQLTGRYNYTQFNNFYSASYDSSVNVVNNPELVASDMKIAVISALWFFKNKVMADLNITSTTTVEEVTEKINGGTKGLAHRKRLYSLSTSNIDCI